MRTPRFLIIRRFLLWLALGPSTYDYTERVLSHDARLRTARLVDIVVRKDGTERRIEADWVKSLAIIVLGRWRSPKLPKRGPFTWVGDIVAWFEQFKWRRPRVDPHDHAFPYDHLAVLGFKQLKKYVPPRPPSAEDDHETLNACKPKDVS